jgi:FKBP-type peptidyl-prolyl cis-trans isomerase
MISRIKLCGFLGTLFVFFLTGCKSDSTWEKQERQVINDYLKTLPEGEAILKTSGLYYIELIHGPGQSPVKNDIVYFKYKGTFLNGIAFDSISITNNLPYEYQIGSGTIVSGVDEGLKYMQVGGRSRLLTPSKLAYGADGIWGSVPGYTPLLWEIELDSIKSVSAKK